MNLKNLVLRPNCLLTKSSLVFVPGPRSLLFYKKPFGILPEFLFEHGYQTATLPLPFQSHLKRQQVLENWLTSKAPKKFHFIMDEFTFNSMPQLISHQQILSLTVLASIKSVPNLEGEKVTYFKVRTDFLTRVTTPLNYRIHQFYCFLRNQSFVSYELTFSKASRKILDRFLDHCIKLAENEFHA